MDTSTHYTLTAQLDKSFICPWNELAPKLRSLIRKFVYSFHVQSWHGQEDDIVEDILQETARRIIERQQKADHGEAPPIQMFERMATVTARNYCKDLRRRDCRIVRLPEHTSSLDILEIVSERNVVDLAEEATEHLYQEGLFSLLACEIVKFPYKQRKVLLIDLANRMCFGATPTLLQKAFLDVGICLEEYQYPQIESAKERSKSAALLYYAYKRISQLVWVQRIATVT